MSAREAVTAVAAWTLIGCFFAVMVGVLLFGVKAGMMLVNWLTGL